MSQPPRTSKDPPANKQTKRAADKDAFEYRVTGPSPPLRGRVELRGAKNAALPMLIAAAASCGPTLLENVPHAMRDIDDMKRLLAAKTPMPALAQRLRSSLVLLGLGLYRHGRAHIPLPGGCAIGRRPYDLHLQGFRALGATVNDGPGGISVEATALTGAEITFSLPSTTATQNIVLAACAATGRTVLRNANTRPENEAFFHMLRAMGASIQWETRLVVVDGPCTLTGGGPFRVPSGGDEALTWLIAAAMTGGDVIVGPIDPSTIAAELDALASTGAHVHRSTDEVRCHGRPTTALKLTTGPPPGVGSDMQPLFGALATCTPGGGTLTDLRFTERFQYLEPLARFGVTCRTYGNTASIEPPQQLTAARVRGGDLRGTMAALLVALRCDGQSVIKGAENMERGYVRPDQTLTSLGASVVRLTS